MEHAVTCQGVYDRQFAPLYEDRNSGATTAKKLWIEPKSEFECQCCHSYLEWKEKRPTLATALQQVADQPTVYSIIPCERVRVVVDGKTVEYIGTIRALAGAPNGACTGEASTGGHHKFTCDNCNALVHGKSSALLHKLNRAS